MKLFLVLLMPVLSVSLTAGQEVTITPLKKEFELALPERPRVPRKGYLVCGDFFVFEEKKGVIHSRIKLSDPLLPPGLLSIYKSKATTILDNSTQVPTVTLVGPMKPTENAPRNFNAEKYIIKISVRDYVEAANCLPLPLPTIG